jgi:hypothetical protein
MLSFLGLNRPAMAQTFEHIPSEAATKLAQTATYMTKHIDGSSTETHVQTVTQNGTPIQNTLFIRRDPSGNIIDQKRDTKEGDAVQLSGQPQDIHSSHVEMTASNPMAYQPKKIAVKPNIPTPQEFQANIQKYFLEVQKQQTALMAKIIELLGKLPTLDPDPVQAPEMIVTTKIQPNNSKTFEEQ